MTPYLLRIVVLALLVCCASLSVAKQEKVKVMVLGSYHMANPKMDVVKSDIRDTLGSERQREIAEVVRMLAKFRPTKIAVEAVGQASLDERYQGFLHGSYTLTADERDQIALRLAKELGLPKIYAIDVRLGIGIPEAMAFIEKHDKPKFDQTNQWVAKIGPFLESLDKRYTVGQLLAIHNSDEMLMLNHSFYTNLISAANETEFPGPDMMGEWYKRNVRIFSRLSAITEPGDRILVLYGAGHAKYLRDLIRDTPTMEFVSPLKFLPPVPADFHVESK